MKIITKFLIPIILFVLVIPSVRELLVNDTFTFHDEAQIANLHQYFKAFDNEQFPPRWAPDVHFEHGSPFLQFNYQLPYYLGYLFHFFEANLFSVYRYLLITSVFMSAFGMYFLARRLTPSIFSLFIALLYTYTPYHGVDVYVRGTVGESFAYALFPWILLTVFELFQKPSFKNSLFTGLSLSLLILTHQPATIIFLPLLVFVFGLVSLIKQNWSFVRFGLLSGVISLALSCYYWLPVVQEMKYLQPQVPFNFIDQFPFMKQLIIPFWGYGASFWGPYDGMSFQIGLVNLAVLSLSLLLLLRHLISNRKKKSELSNPHLLISLGLLVVLGASIILMNSRSMPLWDLFPLTNQIQFPWRLLLIPSIVIPTLFIFCYQYLNRRYATIISIVGIFLVFYSYAGYYHVGERLPGTTEFTFLRRFLPREALLPGETISAEYLKHTEDYVSLPVKAIRPTSLSESYFEVATGAADIKILTRSPYQSTLSISASSSALVHINTFYFPGWHIYANNQSLAVSADDTGRISFTVTAGESYLIIRYEDTPVRRLSNIISLSTWIIFIISFIIIRQRKHGSRN